METTVRTYMDEDVSSRVLMGRTLQNVRALDSDLSGWRISDSSILSLSLVDSRFNHCCANKSRWKELTMDHCVGQHGYYSNCFFDHFVSHSSFLDGSHFVNCQLDQTRSELNSFGMCVFQSSQWRCSHLREVSFIATVWDNCEFRDEDYYFVRFPSAQFYDTRFVNCTLRKVIFRHATFVRCRFESCQLPESVFHNAQFKDTIFDQTDLNEAANIDGVTGLQG